MAGILGLLGGAVGGASPYLLAAILAVGIAIGGTAGYTWEHVQVLNLELKISNQKIEAAKILAEETKKVADAEAKQINLNTELDKSHASFIETTKIYDSKLDTAIDKLRKSASGQGGSSPTTEGDNTSKYSGDAEKFVWVSIELLNYLAEESKRAEIDGIDKNTLLDFVVRDNCGIPKTK